ncbi:MAG TPA: ABC transporter ATP-binding protein [Clostridia bacterium]|nr:ABC transporter ATP-binding protein [Clostridia bacterium]
MNQFDEQKLEKFYDGKLVKKLAKYTKGLWLLLLMSALLLLAGTLFDLLQPRIISTIIDDYLVPRQSYLQEEPQGFALEEGNFSISKEPTSVVLKDQNLEKDGLSRSLSQEENRAYKDYRYKKIINLTLFLLALSILTYLSAMLEQIALNYVGQRVIQRIRSDLFAKLERLSLSFHEKNPVGRLVTRMTNDLGNINELYTNVIVTVLSDVAIILGSIFMMFSMNVKLSFISLSIMPLLVVVTLIFQRKVRLAYRDVRVKLAKINTTLNENLSGMKTIQIFNQEKKFIENFAEDNEKYHVASKGELQIYAIFRPFINLLYYTSLILVIIFGGKFAIEGSIEVGVVIAFTIYVQKLFRPIQDLSEKFTIFQSAMASIERVFMLLEEEETIVNDPKLNPQHLKGDVEFKNVCFSYEKDETVLKNVSFQVKAGETIAFVGATGSGKTTIMSLLTRLYDIDQGEILIDGAPIEDYDKYFLRSRIVPVLQDVFLFSGDIRNNIALLNKDISDERIWEAAEFVNAAHFIRKFPKGLDHHVTEGGSTLSQGERQLLSFARALVHRPDILILDEATASIDTQTELLIQDAIEKVVEGRTTFVVAHRLSTIRGADKIIVMHKGAIAEMGTHDELLEEKGLYADLHRLQYAVQEVQE